MYDVQKLVGHFLAREKITSECVRYRWRIALFVEVVKKPTNTTEKFRDLP